MSTAKSNSNNSIMKKSKYLHALKLLNSYVFPWKFQGFLNLEKDCAQPGMKTMD